MQPRRSFVLVLTLLLLVLLAATGAAFSVTGATEGIAGAAMASSLQHELGVESVLACLPGLRQHRTRTRGQDGNSPTEERYRLTVGRCEVECRVRSERDKAFLRTVDSNEETAARLRRLARDNGLREESVRLRPARFGAGEERLGSFFGFDQIVDSVDFDQPVRWRLPSTDARERAEGRAWSDLVTFWSARGGEQVALEIETRIGSDWRCWYVVAAIEAQSVSILHRSSAP